MDCKVLLDSKKIIINKDELNFNSSFLPVFLFDEGAQNYRFKQNNLKYLSDEIELLISKRSNTVYVLFKTPEFFEDNLLNSKILKRFKKKYILKNDDFIIEHPTKIFLIDGKHEWGGIKFSYDPRQGDITMAIDF